MSNNYGAGVSRVLDPATTQFLSVLWQEGNPPLDSEWNLVGDLAADSTRQAALRGTPSGWLGNDINPSKDYVTNPTWSNWFRFGRQRSSDKQSIMWAAVNGWLIPVTGTRTGTPPGAPDNIDTWNKITLDPPPGTTGDARADFVFLEVWKARISPPPSTTNKPNGSAIYKYGNVEGGFSYLADDLIDPAIGEKTTERIQLQYRIRVVKGLINLATYPDGFDPSAVKAQGAQATPPSVGGFSFVNMREELGDPGLWRAGDGTDNDLGTVDGYVYAIPICIVFRRNATAWAGEPSQNLNGGFNRNPAAVDRSGIATFSTVATTSAGINSSVTTIGLVSVLNIQLPASPTSPVLIQIDEELMTYTSISGSNLSGVTRGVNGTVATVHKAGSVVTVISGRPDGLFSDQITGTDILDLRHAVNPAGFNYESVLRSNLDKLLKGQLRANWKTSGTYPRGPFLTYEDKISATAAASVGITKLDPPDHVRMVFSDAAVQQPVEVLCRPTTLPATFPLVDGSTQTWDLLVHSDILAQSSSGVWSVGDQIRIPVAQFKPIGYPTDQLRILNDQPASGTSSGASFGTNQFVDGTSNYTDAGVEIGDTLVIFSGAAAGSYTITSVTSTVLTVSTTIPTAPASSYVIRKGIGAVQIRIEGSATPLAQHMFQVTPPNPSPTDDLVIQFLSGPFPTTGTSRLYITIHLQYGGGRGLSRRPDSIHNIVLLNPNSKILYHPKYNQAHNFQLPTGWTSLWSKFRGSTYKSLLPVTASAYADLGSKTVALTPFQTIAFPITPALTPITGSIMQPAGADPLALFDHTRYLLLPRHLIPGWGEVRLPILPSTTANYARGINFMLMSYEGAVAGSSPQLNQTYINYSIGVSQTCAIFATVTLDTLAPITYNTAYTYSGGSYAGIRHFNDDPTVPGALSTARGLGRKGLELPPFYGIARLFAVYEAEDYHDLGSSFSIDTNRTYTGLGAINLLRDDFDGPVFWIELDANGDSTFILNADAIDITKSTNHPISSFDAGNFAIEACIFGFDRGSFDITQPFKLALSSAAPTPASPNMVLPGPLFSTDTALVNYSRTPYQGDAWGTEMSFSDKGFTPGPLTSADAYQLASTSLLPTGLTRPNQKPLEVLASIGFITTLGTGRLSGDLSLANAYDVRNVGYEDPTDPSAPYPPTSPSGPRPIVKSGALGSLANYGDLEANPEYLGCTERLPLGSLYRDKDFHGSRFSDELSSPLVYIDTAGVGSGVAGLAQTVELDQDEVLAMPASVSAGVPGDVLVMVDGDQSDYTQLLNYRVNRGGSLFMGSGDRPGGELFATYSRLLGSGKGSRVLVGRAFLARNAPTTAGSVEVSGGDELMMVVATEVMELGTTPIEALLLMGTNGTGEGYAAADLYRIEGHPLIPNHTFYDVDPASINLPKGKTIPQITAPSPTPVIPIGAADTVYASDGIHNFWTNVLSVTGLDVYDLTVSHWIQFTATDNDPTLYQIAGAPGVSTKSLRITAQNYVANTSSLGYGGGSLYLVSGEVTGAAGGLYGNTGPLLIQTPNLSSNVSGNTGLILIGSGSNAGGGNSGILTIFSGSITAATGLPGVVDIHGGSISNVSNPNNAGGVILTGGNTTGSGSGGSVVLQSGTGTGGSGTIDVKVGSTLYGRFSNASLLLGALSNYKLLFSNTTTNPMIGQDVGTGAGAHLTIYSQDAASPGNFNGGNIVLRTGIGNGTGTTGVLSVANGLRTNLTVSSVDTESVFLGPNVVEVGDPFNYDLFSITFSSRVLAPKIGQKPTNGSGETLTIKAADVGSVFEGNGGDLALFSGNAIGSVSNPYRGGDLYLKAGKGSFDRSGYILMQIENGTTVSPSPVTLATFSQAGVILNIDDLVFDPAVGIPLISQQNATAGNNGVDLKIQAQKGDQTTGSSHNGGSLILTSGAHGPSGGSNGTIDIRIGTHGYPRAVFDEFGLALRNTELVSSNSGLGLDNCTNDPPTPPGGLSSVLYLSGFDDLKVSTVSRGVSTLNSTVARIVDTSAFTASPVTSSSPTLLITTPPDFTGVVNGDIVEGSANFHVTANASPGNFATIYLIAIDGATLDVYQVSISLATAIDQVITVPFSYTAGPSTTGTVEIRPEAASSDGTTAVNVATMSTSGKWLFAKHTRP